MIKAFEFTHELAWNVMKDYFQYQGNSSITGSRDAIREAFQRGLPSLFQAFNRRMQELVQNARD